MEKVFNNKLSNRLIRANNRGKKANDNSQKLIEKLAASWLEASIREAEGNSEEFALQGVGVTSWSVFSGHDDAMAMLYKSAIVSHANVLLSDSEEVYAYDMGTCLGVRCRQEKTPEPEESDDKEVEEAS